MINPILIFKKSLAEFARWMTRQLLGRFRSWASMIFG